MQLVVTPRAEHCKKNSRMHFDSLQAPDLNPRPLQPHLAESEDGVDVGVVLLDLLPEPHRLVVLSRVDVLGPASLEVVHALAHELGAQSVHLQ